jgi:hypothetical protein
MLDKELKKFSPLAAFSINTTEGRVVLFWKPNHKFNYQNLKRVFQGIGLGFFNPFEMRVRGTISSKGRNMYLTSIGDNTTFMLLDVAPRSQTQYVTRGNIDVHRLREPLLSKLREAEVHYRVVEVKGELFMPEAPFAPPDKIIINKFTVPEREL